MDISSAIREIQRYKTSTANFYAWLAGLFTEDREAYAVFYKLNMREQAHIDLGNYQIRTIRKAKNEFSNIDVDAGYFQEKIDLVEEFRKKEPTLKEALYFVRQLEQDSPLCHCAALMNKHNRPFAELLGQLSITCNAHCDDIREFIESRLTEPAGGNLKESSGVTLGKALNAMAELSLSMSSMYANLSIQYAGNLELGKFFSKMKSEETAYYGALELEKARLRNTPKFHSGSLDMDIAGIDKINIMVNYLARMSLTITQVLTDIFLIERGVLQACVSGTIKTAPQSLKPLLLKADEKCRSHIDAVTKAARQRVVNFDALTPAMRNIRIPFNEDVLVDNKILLRSVDLSKGGIFLHTDRVFTVNTPLVLSFKLSYRQLTVSGEVRFFKQNTGIGVEFTNPEESGRLLIDTYIDDVVRMPEPSASKGKLLFIEMPDESDNHRHYKSYLRSNGYKVLEPRGYADALLSIREEQGIDVVIIALDNESSDYFGLISLWKKTAGHAKSSLVVISANNSPAFERSIYGAGADILFRKNTGNPAKLLEVVDRCLSLKKHKN